MNEMNIPYLNPYMDVSPMNTPFEKPNTDMIDKKPISSPKMALAMAYVPDQPWETPYEVTEGLDRGTIFPSLDKPFLGGGKRI